MTLTMHSLCAICNGKISCSYGKVQWSLLMPSHAKKSFEKAIKLEPRLWPAWRELVDLVENMAEVSHLHNIIRHFGIR